MVNMNSKVSKERESKRRVTVAMKFGATIIILTDQREKIAVWA